jgi:hypothetical protein
VAASARLRRAANRLLAAALALAAAAAAANLYPDPLFAYSARHGAFTIRSDRPIGPAMARVIADAERRLRTSELYDPSERFDLFICNARWRLMLLTRSGAVGGSTDTMVTRNIYIREAHIEGNRVLIGRDVLADADARPLSYFIAHEAAHVIQSRRFGRLLSLRTPKWLVEGHADMIGKGGQFDAAANRALLRADDPIMRNDHARRGLYRRYHLMVAATIAGTGRTAAQLFADPPAEQEALGYALGR